MVRMKPFRTSTYTVPFVDWPVVFGQEGTSPSILQLRDGVLWIVPNRLEQKRTAVMTKMTPTQSEKNFSPRVIVGIKFRCTIVQDCIVLRYCVHVVIIAYFNFRCAVCLIIHPFVTESHIII